MFIGLSPAGRRPRGQASGGFGQFSRQGNAAGNEAGEDASDCGWGEAHGVDCFQLKSSARLLRLNRKESMKLLAGGGLGASPLVRCGNSGYITATIWQLFCCPRGIFAAQWGKRRGVCG
jgi:hypothetical protein